MRQQNLQLRNNYWKHKQKESLKNNVLRGEHQKPIMLFWSGDGKNPNIHKLKRSGGLTSVEINREWGTVEVNIAGRLEKHWGTDWGWVSYGTGNTREKELKIDHLK